MRPKAVLSKRSAAKYLPFTRRVFGISIPHFFANNEYLYSISPTFLGSELDLNFTSHSLPPILANTLGRAPPDEPPFLKSVSSEFLSTTFSSRIFRQLWAILSKSLNSAFAIRLLSGRYSNAPRPFEPISDSLSKIENFDKSLPCSLKNLSSNKVPQPSGRESSNTPKFPSNGSRSAIKTFFSSGKAYGEIEKPFSRKLASYSNAQRPSDVSAIRPTSELESHTSTKFLSIFRSSFPVGFFFYYLFNRRIFSFCEKIFNVSCDVEKLGNFHKLAQGNFSSGLKTPICRQRNPNL